MSCNGCRVLRKACAPNCTLRTSLQWIPVPEAQGNATLFLAKFFGRSDLLALIAAVPESQRPAMFGSLLFEACGRTVNPVNGAVGLLTTGNWQVCQDAVSTVLCGGTLQPLPVTVGDNQTAAPPISDPSPYTTPINSERRRSHFTGLKTASSICSEMSSEMLTVETSCYDGAASNSNGGGGGTQEMKLLNLFN